MIKIIAVEEWALRRKDTNEVILRGDASEKSVIPLERIVIPLAIGNISNEDNNKLVEVEIIQKDK